MPKYDYICKCGHTFEVEKSYADNRKEKCPKCKSVKVRKIIGLSPTHFKGDGFTLSKSEE